MPSKNDEPTNPYFNLHKSFYNRLSVIGPSAVMLYIHLMSYVNWKKVKAGSPMVSWPPISKISTKTGLHHETIHTAMERLIVLGYLQVEKIGVMHKLQFYLSHGLLDEDFKPRQKAVEANDTRRKNHNLTPKERSEKDWQFEAFLTEAIRED